MMCCVQARGILLDLSTTLGGTFTAASLNQTRAHLEEYLGKIWSPMKEAVSTSRDTKGALSLISMASDVLRVLQRSELVHKLQRERGVTCGSVASSDPTLFFSGRMLEQREQTFLSFSDTDLLPAETATLQQLQQIRARADSFIKQVDKSGEQAAVAFYSIFSQFNQLILAVLDRTAGGSIDRPRHNNFEIFDAFARLKEATGVERAFLCGALALHRQRSRTYHRGHSPIS